MDPLFGLVGDQNTSTEPIYYAAVSCLAIFDEYLRESKVPEQPSKRNAEQLHSEVEELRGQFKQWAAYIGAFAATRASLDARLTFQTTTREMLLELLALLRLNMRWVIVHNDVEQRDADVPGLGAVRAVIKRLFVLAVDIRRSARESHQIRPGAWTEQSQFLSVLLRIRYPHTRPSLLSQLAASIHTRGTSLRYLQRHNEKLAFDRNSVAEPQRDLQSATRAVNPQASIPAMLSDPVSARGPNLHVVDTKSTRDTTHSAFSQTNVDRYRARKRPSDSIVSKGSAVGDGATADEDQYPPIPTGQESCSICADPLNLSKMTERDWELHVNRDLESYVCISEECLDPPKFFASFTEWMDHMQTRHTMDWAQRIHTEQWYCHLCTEVEFDDKAALLAHLHAQHSNKLTMSQMQGRARRNRRIAKRKDAFACPLCDCVPNSILPHVAEKPYKRLAQHVARHLQSLSFLSLSYMDIDYGGGEGSENCSKNTAVIGGEEGTNPSQGSRVAALVDEGFWDMPETLIMDNDTRTVTHALINDLDYYETVESFEDDPPPLDYWQYWHFLPSPNLRIDFAALRGFVYSPSLQLFALIPFRRDTDFVPRGDILDQIDRRYAYPPHRVALVGLGGVGKSQLAIEFAYRIHELGAASVFWVHAGSRTRVEEGFRTIADAVKLAGRAEPKVNITQLVCHWLSNEWNGSWLMVLDSADDQDVFFSTVEGVQEQPLAMYLPQSPKGCILVTTRDKQLAHRLVGKRSNLIEMGPMREMEALTLLKTKLGLDSYWDEEAAGDLIHVLDLIPLAISQAAAYIQAGAPGRSLKTYLDEFRKSELTKARLLTHDAGDLRRDSTASNAVLTTWHISFEHIRSMRPSAADLLALMSFFDRSNIPKWVLKDERLRDGVYIASDNRLTEDESEDESVGNEGNAKDEFEDNLAILQNYCLVTVKGEGDDFEMHSLVQLSTREWLEALGLQETFQQRYVERMAAAFPTAQYENWSICRTLFAHVQAALNYQPNNEGVKQWTTLLYNGGRFAWLQGRYDVAKMMVSKAQKALEKRFGKNDRATLSSTSLFALITKNQGRWDEAERLEVEVMEIYKTMFGADYPDTLMSMGNLASTFRNQGRWEEAEKLEVQVMEGCKIKLGPDHPDTLTSMSNLASTYRNQGRWEEAKKLEVQVMESRKMMLGPDHPDTLTSMANLASTYRDQGRWEDAEKLQLQVVESRKMKLGPDHPDTLTSMANLASTYQDQGRWEEAESLEIQVMEMSKTKLGADHPSTLTSMGNLASTYRKQGRWEEAEKLEVQVTKSLQSKLGADHPDTLTSMANLASTYRDQGRWKEAEKLEVEVMESRKTKLGVNHPSTLTSMANLASIHSKQGRWEEAEKLEEQVIESRKTKLGADHPSTLTSMGNLASTYWKQGRWSEAETLGVQVMESRQTKLGANHPDTLTSMANLAFTWESQGRHSDAIRLMKDCAQARRRVFGPTHPNTLSSLAAVQQWSGSV